MMYHDRVLGVRSGAAKICEDLGLYSVLVCRRPSWAVAEEQRAGTTHGLQDVFIVPWLDLLDLTQLDLRSLSKPSKLSTSASKLVRTCYGRIGTRLWPRLV